MVRDVPIDIDLEVEFTATPDRTQPAHGLPRLGAPRPAPPARGGARGRRAGVDPAPRGRRHDRGQDRPARNPRDITRLKGDELSLAVLPPEIPEGELIPREPKWRFAAYAGGNIALAGEIDDPADVIAAAGDRAVIAHDAKALSDVPAEPRLRHRGRRLPARPGPPRLPARRAVPRSAASPPTPATSSPPRAVLIHELAQAPAPADRRTRPPGPAGRRRAPARPRPARDREGRHQARHEAARDGRHPHQRADVIELEREIWDARGRGVHDRLAAAARRRSCSRSSALSRKRRGKTGFSTDDRVLQAIRDEHAIIPKIERYRELSKLAQTYLDALPNWIGDDGRLHTTFEQTTAATGRLSSHQPEPPEHPDPHRDRPRDPRLLHPRARQRPAQRRLRPGRAARARAHRQRAGAAGHLPPRRGRPHRDRERRLRAAARAARRRHALARPRWSTTGSSTASPPTASPTACRSRRRRRRSSSTATSSASRPSRSS